MCGTGRAQRKSRVTRLVEVDEAHLQTVADREQRRIAEAELAILNGIGRGFAHRVDILFVKDIRGCAQRFEGDSWNIRQSVAARGRLTFEVVIPVRKAWEWRSLGSENQAQCVW